MTLTSCPACGAPAYDDAVVCPQCGVSLDPAATTSEEQRLRQAGLHSPYEAATGHEEAGERWERYEIPWFDVPGGMRAIVHPGEVRPADRREKAGKYATRSLILSLVGLLLAFSPVFWQSSLLVGALGTFWGLVALRLGRKSDRQWTAVIGFIVGGWVCFNFVMTVVINAG
jgi:hypothetical protein